MCRQIYISCCRLIYMNTETIAQAATTRGYGIAVLRNLRSGQFHTARTYRGKFVVISNHATEADARARANREWTRDRLGAAAPCEMICA